MRLYFFCYCGHPVRLKGHYNSYSDLRQHQGDFIQLQCPHCHKKSYFPYTSAYPETWGPWLTVAILSAVILASVALTALLQQAGAPTLAVIWIPIAALTLYALLAKRESDSVERFNSSYAHAPSPLLTPEIANTWSDIDLLDWYDIDEPEDINPDNPYERTLYYATALNHEEAPRYMEWFYYYETNYNPLHDDGTELYNCLIAVGATHHASIVLQARQIYQQHKAEIEQCVRSVTHDGYQLLLSRNLFQQQDDALAQAFLTEPLTPLVAQYIRNHINQLENPSISPV